MSEKNQEQLEKVADKERLKKTKENVLTILKWLLLAFLTGYLVGGISSLFSFALSGVTSYRGNHPVVFLLLPVAGVIIVFLYDKIGHNDGGTNQVFLTIKEQDEVPFRSAPLIFVATVLTHFAGGSAGREGAAIQLGGSVGNQLGRWFKLDKEDTHVIVMCGMSAAFAALFGTPMAAAIFAMEVVSVGIMYYTALFPCVVSALVATHFAAGLGIHPEVFHVSGIPNLNLVSGLKMGLISVLCGGLSIVFCVLLQRTGNLFKKWFENKYIRVIVGSLIIIAITAILHTTDYMGAGTGIIEEAIEHGNVDTFAFFWKMILTAITMKIGFRGGEIVPSFCIGAAFGCVLGQLFGLSPSLCAAAGMIAVFSGVTNCPITSILIAFELFGFEGASYYLIAAAVSYAVSGYYSLYKDQTIVYSKYKAKYVNQRTQM